MNFWKLPPKEKIYEAFSVLADNRYLHVQPGMVKVGSSDGSKQYTVEWTEQNSTSGTVIKIASDDNASFWQGYIGYPIIAVLMINDLISFDRTIIDHFKGIPWKTLNKQFGNNYSKAVGIVLSGIDDKVMVEKIRSEVESIYGQLSALQLINPSTRLKG